MQQPIIDGRNEMNGVESAGDRIKEKFVEAIVEMVTEALDVNYRERRNFQALLKNLIKDKITDRSIKDRPGGLLEQYLHNEMRKTLPKFKDTFGLNDEVDIVESHASHAKMNKVVEAIKEKYDGKQKAV
ncbi:hypothetical protein [Gracilimonas mengyeensis]|uniref:Uncharacterized protein n=1 Tax=Gracilimonas mengyeensis TaxID=1302730 RepID=A0A521ET11_9BACT|nr:hypothetical protein [Gracilimonas mengyeensis]SMO87059.1 hypothetical protein SAMN06265219_113124 [Gracilimonas mengyeensis]